MSARFGLRSALLCAVFACLIFSGSASAAQWAKMYGSTGDDSAGGVWPAGDGNYNLAGSTTSFGAGSRDAIFAKLDPSGNVIWAKTVGGKADDSLVIDPIADGFFVSGITTSFGPAGTSNMVWANFDSTLTTPVYQKVLAGSGTLTAGAFLPAKDGGLIFTGSIGTFGADTDILVFKTNPTTGAILWKKVFHYGTSDRSGPVTVETDDSGYLVSGSIGNLGLTNIALIKLTSAGAVSWKRMYAIAPTAGIVPGAPIIKKTADGGFLLYESMMSFTGQFRILLIKVNSAGTLQWQKSYSKTSYDISAMNVWEDPDTSIIVSGQIMDASHNSKILIMKLDSTGAILMQKSFGGTVSDTGFLLKAEDGQLLFSGLHYATTSSPSDILYGKFDTNYDPVWLKTFGGALDDGGLLLNDSAQYMLGGFTDSFGAGAGTTNMFGMALDSNGDYPGCYVNPITLTKTDPAGITAAAVTFTASTPTLTERTIGTESDIVMTPQSVALPQTELCAAIGNPPAAPSFLNAASLSPTSIELSWQDNAKGETGFKIERKPGGCAAAGTWTQITAKGANMVTHVDASRAANTAYSYRVRSYDANGNSAYSNCAAATTGVTGSPNAPTALKATSTAASAVNLSWTDGDPNATSFKIYRKTGAGTWGLIKTVTAKTYSDTTASGNAGSSAYSYYVTACKAAVCSQPSVTAVVPYRPITLTAAAGSTGSHTIKLKWADKSLNETGFQVFRKQAACTSTSGTWTLVKATGVNAVSFGDTGLTAGADYCYRVRAFIQSAAQPYALGYSLWSNTAGATAP
jgi:hypothetical protein